MGTWPFNVYPEDKDFFEEWNYKPKENEPAQPSGKMTAARVMGRLARGLIKEPLEWGGEVMNKAYRGEATMQDAIGAALMAMPPGRGGGLGAGPRVKAMPWQSRTLDALLGNSQAGKKFPEAATPQTWISKLKGSGLPGDEVSIANDVIGGLASPKSKLNRQQVSDMLQDPNVTGMVGRPSLPEQGITKTVLGGEEWAAGQKRMPEIGDRLYDLELSINNIRGEWIAANPTKELTNSEWMKIRKSNPEAAKLVDEKKSLINEQMELSQNAVGKRPHWSQYQLEGVENPREILYHGKSPSGESYTAPKADSHWGDKGENLAWNQFEGDLKMSEGKMSTHISGQQSEWIAKHAQDNLPSITDGEGKVYKKSDLMVEEYGPGGFIVRTRGGGEAPDLPVYNHVEDAYNAISTGGVPTPPMKENWYKAGLKDAVNRAVESGHDYLSWDTAETMSKRWPDPNEKTHKFFQEHYNQKMGKFLEKEYGVKPERVEVKPPGPVDGYSIRIRDGIDIPFRDLDIEQNLRTEMFRVVDRATRLRIDAPWNEFRTTEAAYNWMRDHSIKTSDKGQDVWRIPITEEMKRKILLEGQYFSKKDQVAKPGGQDAQMAA